MNTHHANHTKIPHEYRNRNKISNNVECTNKFATKKSNEKPLKKPPKKQKYSNPPQTIHSPDVHIREQKQ